MKLSQIKNVLTQVEKVNFKLSDGTYVPEHFHVTEIGLIDKKFIDCGGTVRNEIKINFQLWDANDFDHRLKPQKLLDIITLSEDVLNIQDYEIEVEYQSSTIGKYDLDFDGIDFVLRNKQTACLASDQCGVPLVKPKIKLSDLNQATNCCTPDGGCC